MIPWIVGIAGVAVFASAWFWILRRVMGNHNDEFANYPTGGSDLTH